MNSPYGLSSLFLSLSLSLSLSVVSLCRYCKDVHIHHMEIQVPWMATIDGKNISGFNGDGIDVDSCQNVLIEHNFINCGDDHVTILSGVGAAGKAWSKKNWVRLVPTGNVPALLVYTRVVCVGTHARAFTHSALHAPTTHTLYTFRSHNHTTSHFHTTHTCLSLSRQRTSPLSTTGSGVGWASA